MPIFLAARQDWTPGGIESGKVARSQHAAKGGAFLRIGWEAPRDNLSWGREVACEDLFALPGGLGPDHCHWLPRPSLPRRKLSLEPPPCHPAPVGMAWARSYHQTCSLLSGPGDFLTGYSPKDK